MKYPVKFKQIFEDFLPPGIFHLRYDFLSSSLWNYIQSATKSCLPKIARFFFYFLTPTNSNFLPIVNKSQVTGRIKVAHFVDSIFPPISHSWNYSPCPQKTGHCPSSIIPYFPWPFCLDPALSPPQGLRFYLQTLMQSFVHQFFCKGHWGDKPEPDRWGSPAEH